MNKTKTTETPEKDAIPRVNLNDLLRSVNDASSSARVSWLVFIILTLYLFVTISSVTHVDLFLNAPVKLPLLGIFVPLKYFYMFAPLVYILVHFMVFTNHVLLAQKAEVFDTYTSARETLAGQKMDTIRYQLSPYFLTQMIAGPSRTQSVGRYLNDISWLSLTVLPVILLLYFQISYLPFHDLLTTWFHRGLIVTDALLILSLGTYLSSSLRGFFRALFDALRFHFFRTLVTYFFLGASIILSLFVATIPGEQVEKGTKYLNALVPESMRSNKNSFFISEWLFEGDVDPVTGKNKSLFQRNLFVADEELGFTNGSDKGKVLRLRGRDLRYATFDRSNLSGIDFSGADLTSSSLAGTVLDRTNFIGAKLDNVKFWKEKDQWSDPRPASIKFAKFQNARLNGAVFYAARLEGANFSGAKLNGANFERGGAQGANFAKAELVGANFNDATLEATNFSSSRLYGVSFERASLQGAWFFDTSILGTSFHDANLDATDFRSGNMWLVKPGRRNKLIDLRWRQFNKPDQKELDWVKAVLAKLPDELSKKINARLNKIFKASVDLGWTRTNEYRKWRTKLTLISKNKDQNYRQELTQALSHLACNENNKEAIISSSLAKRAASNRQLLSRFNGDAELYYVLTSNPRKCDIGLKYVPFEAKAELVRLVQSSDRVQKIYQAFAAQKQKDEDEKLELLKQFLQPPAPVQIPTTEENGDAAQEITPEEAQSSQVLPVLPPNKNIAQPKEPQPVARANVTAGQKTDLQTPKVKSRKVKRRRVKNRRRYRKRRRRR